MSGITIRRPSAPFHDGSMLVMLPMGLVGPWLIWMVLQRWSGFTLGHLGMLVGAVLFTVHAMRTIWKMFRHYAAQPELRLTADEVVLTNRWWGAEERRFPLAQLSVRVAVETGPDDAEWRVLYLADAEGEVAFPIGRVVDGEDYAQLAEWTETTLRDAKATHADRGAGGDREELERSVASIRGTVNPPRVEKGTL